MTADRRPPTADDRRPGARRVPAAAPGSTSGTADPSLWSLHMTHTFDELVEKQRAADQAHTRVEELRESYGPPTHEGGWSGRQTDTYETAWRAWRDLAREAQATAAEYAKDEGRPRDSVEAEVKRAVRHTGHTGPDG